MEKRKFWILFIKAGTNELVLQVDYYGTRAGAFKRARELDNFLDCRCEHEVLAIDF